MAEPVRPPAEPVSAPAGEGAWRRTLPAWWSSVLAGPRPWHWAGVGLLVAWCCWFAVCLGQKPMPRVVPYQGNYFEHRVTYILLEPLMGLDFHHNYVGVRTWREGKDPYAQLLGDPANTTYVYPPLNLVAFAWVDLFSPGPNLQMTTTDGRQTVFAPSGPAIYTWTVLLLCALGFCAWQSWRTRGALGLEPLPLSFLLGAVLVSYPVVFELERGNCNVLPALAVALIVTATGWENRWRGDWAAGLAAAFAAGVKPYAIVLLAGLVAMRRWRAALFGVVGLLAQAVILSPELRHWLAVAQKHNQTQTPVYQDFSHSVVAHWQLLWRDLGLGGVAALPGQVTTAAILFVVMSAVAWPVLQRRSIGAAAWPFLLWVTAMGTMLLPIAHDYNLLFIPLAVLSAWSARDPWPVQLCAAAVLLWWQPFFIGMTGLPWLLIKVASVAGIGVLVVRRVREIPIAPRHAVSASPASTPVAPVPVA